MKATRPGEVGPDLGPTGFLLRLRITPVCVFQGGRRVGARVSAWRPPGCVAFVLTGCGAASTGLSCRVWSACTAAGGDVLIGAAVARETAAAPRSDPRPALRLGRMCLG